MAFRKRIEHSIDKAIPFCLILILLILIAEIFFHQYTEPYQTLIEILDYIIITVFAADLFFKYQRLKNKNEFIKKYWIEIIAIFPFMLFFRTIESLIAVEMASREIKEAQTILHETVEFKRAARGTEGLRTARFIKILRPILRIPRLFKAVPFFEKPHKAT